MGGLLKLSALVDRLNRAVGQSLYWVVLVVVLISAVNAIIRKFFDMSSNAWLETQWYLFSLIFLCCAGYTLLRNEHIRIDIVNSGLSKTTRNWIDITGHIFFLIPLCVIMLSESWPYFMKAFQLDSHGFFSDLWRLALLATGASSETYKVELSSNAGGLIRWPAKLIIVLGFSLLLLQGLSELVKRIAVMLGRIPDPHEHKSGPH
ncbi:MAG: TRAP transporter small permease subunit [Alphaproteobacteria bacterium]|nr:TRAP transporter small permease subunit [Alphaproteobacteria bacterium]